MSQLRWAAAVLSIAAFAAAPALAQTPFFSGAEGYGGSFLGSAPAGGWFSNATVYHVTNLNDDGPGSLREAFVERSSNKIVVFDVAGTIELTSDSLDIKNLSNYYIAGQSAPGEVTVTGDTVQITHSSDKDNTNVVLRYMTFRKGVGEGSDALTFAGGNNAIPNGIGSNMILDHVSVSWAEDENLSVANNNTNITVQHSIIADATGGSHSYGSLIRPRSAASVSFHHNLYANNRSRQPRLGSYNGTLLTADVRNNVMYNWSDRATYAGGSSESDREQAEVNYVGNYLVAGPWTNSNVSTAFVVDKNIDVDVYQSGNFIDSDKALNPGGIPNGTDTGWGMFSVSPDANQGVLTQLGSPVATAPVTTQAAIDAYNDVIAHAGNSAWGRGAIDQRIVGNVTGNTAPSNGPAPDAPIASELSSVLNAPMVQHPAGWDTDGDAMPDHWELAHGLDPNSAADWNLDFDLDGYINLIEYLNERGEFPATAPLSFQSGGNGRYAEIENWRTDDGGVTTGVPWQPSRHDAAHIDSGAVVVDSVGQHAGLLTIATNEGDNASLSVTAGWLAADEGVVIGGDDSATASLVLSGGLLSTPRLTKSAGGSFNFTGGVLETQSVNFVLSVDGGTLAPGMGVGELQIGGGLSILNGSLEIEIASTDSADQIVVQGAITLGGDLLIVAPEGFDPAGGAWEIARANSIDGAFASITEGFAVFEQGGSLWLAAALDGDFNGDGSVDAADYTVWRDGVGVDYTESDYDLWVANYGASISVGAAAIPEPASVALLAFGGSLALLRRTGRPLASTNDRA